MSERNRTKSTTKTAITRNRDWREPFLLALATSGNVGVACVEAGIARVTAYDRRRSDKQFVKRWRTALNDAADLLELEARRRAAEGVNEPVIFQGELCGEWVSPDGEPAKKGDPDAKFIPLTIKRYSDTLMMFLLKGIRPKKFRDNVRHEHTGNVHHTHKHSVVAKLRGKPQAFDAALALSDRLLNDN